MKRALAAVAALLAVTAVLAVLSLPPATLVLEGAGDGAVPGVVHVHTNRSDGLSSPDEIAAAAARAGLSFVIFTDHGNGTRTPDPPMYRSGVLCLDAVEISTDGGHYVAIGLPPAPYPLGGDARGVVEDVRRLGGVGVAAHPDSTDADMGWDDWTLPVDGVELLNLDTVWRRRVFEPGWRPKWQLIQALLAYPISSHEAIGNLLSVSADNAQRYGDLLSRQDATAIVAVDAHSKVTLGTADPGDNRWALPFPGYETVFRTLQVRLLPEQPLAGDATTDARLVVDAIRAGRLYGANVAVAGPPLFEFTAERPNGSVGQGQVLSGGAPATLRVRSNAPVGFETVVFAGGEILASTREQSVDVEIGGETAEYRVEIRAADRTSEPVWIVSNPIYLRSEEITSRPLPPLSVPGDQTILFGPNDQGAWRVESDPASTAELTVESNVSPITMRLEYGLGDGARSNQFAAFVVDLPDGAAQYDRLSLRVRSQNPARLSVQTRAAVNQSTDDRWARSVYVEDRWQDITIPLGDMRPIGQTRTPTPPAASIHSILFALEMTNTAPGATGVIEIERVVLQGP